MIPHFGGPRDFLDDNCEDASSAPESALNNTGFDIETCSDDCIKVNTTSTVIERALKDLQATESMCYYCFDVLIQELRKKSPQRTSSKAKAHFVDSLPNQNVECPFFVTWEKQSRSFRSNSSRSLHSAAECATFELRGCIGSLTPKLLLRNLQEYAILSAFHDHRFQPITVEEVSYLRVSVSLLIQYETCQDCYDWEVGTHGIIIKFTSPKANGHNAFVRGQSSAGEFSATFLPEVAAQQYWDQKKAVHHLIRKAGYKGSISDPLIKSIHCTRYQSSKCKVSFQEYVVQHLGLQATAGGDDDGDDAKQFIKDMIEEKSDDDATKHSNDTATPNCCIM